VNEPPPADAPETRTASFRLGWGGRVLQAEVAVPAGPVRRRVLLPMVQQLTNALVGLAEDRVKDDGGTISCRAGCGACCRQVVPVSETEAHHIRDLVEALPEPRRAEVKGRFADARRRFADAGLLDALRDPDSVADKTALGLAYFRLGIPCPFLDDESCSIHPDRPLGCREYLVTSPAENCRNPSPETIRRVETPGWVMTSFAALDGPPARGGGIRWVPLVLAPEWAEANPEPPPDETGPDLFGRFMTLLTGKSIPPPVSLVDRPPESPA
jgi:Fe-S-cluster containining protein